MGVNLYAKQLVDGRSRRQLERLCRYLLRPPIVEERIRSLKLLCVSLKLLCAANVRPEANSMDTEVIFFDHLLAGPIAQCVTSDVILAYRYGATLDCTRFSFVIRTEFSLRLLS